MQEREAENSKELSAFFKAFADWHANLEQIVAEDILGNTMELIN